jgi:antitoxin component YwqK of YwqJK toxin-antitoxin module
MKALLTFLFIFIYQIVSAQADCYYFDDKTDIAYAKKDSFPYTGNCDEYFSDGKLKYCCVFEGGIIKSQKKWNKKGIIIDSIVYINGFKEYTEFRFSDEGQLKQKITVKKLGNIKTKLKGEFDFYPVQAEAISYYKNGNIWIIENYENRTLNGISRYFYKNGQLNEEKRYQHDTLINPVFEWDEVGNKYEVIYDLNKAGKGNVALSRKLIGKKE